jgi:signal transduction histidine kinase
VGLTEQLKERMEELRASRQRIVAAADEERRRLERAVHDGAQEQLTALSVKAKLAEDLAERDPEEARGLVEQLQAGAGEALENLRDLARGVYPPLLADRGLPAALEAQARKLPFPAVVEADGIGRYPQGSEAAIYFCVLEALQNVAKYSGASNVVVRVEERDDRLTFTVTDDGIGFDPGRTGYGTGLQSMADRLAALDGELLVRSTPGKGATVAGRLPVRALEHAS